jgi:ATP-dependent RNA helicase DeaD
MNEPDPTPAVTDDASDTPTDETATEAPVEVPTEASAESATEAPVEVPTESVVEATAVEATAVETPAVETPAVEAPAVEELNGFAELGLRPELLRCLTDLGYEEPTPIQREAIPHLVAGSDLVGQAATGTGKTAAFALPVLERLPAAGEGKAECIALILVPTRELAIQVCQATYRYGRHLRAQVVPIYGGQHIGRQLDALRRGAHVVVATPGRALDHIRRGTLPLDTVQMVVLDEADEMLDMGFAEDLEAILDATPSTRQTVLFSATMPPRIASIAKKHLRNPVHLQIRREATAPGEAPKVRQSAYVVPRAHKPAALGRILDIEAPKAAIVFCRTRGEVDDLTETLNGRGYRAEALHGGMSQEQRDKVMGRLRSGTAELLVATDVAARGLDIDQLTHVVNYDVPSAPEAYVHRIGRVGRAGREGVAITLAEPREQRLLGNIERLTKQSIAIERVPSVADLQARQMELTVGTVREALTSDDLDAMRPVVEALVGEYELVDIALAALKLAHEASGAAADTVEIPDLTAKFARNDTRPDRKGATGRNDDKGWREGKQHRAAPSGRPAFKGGGDRGTARIYIGVGRNEGVRPQDLVGALANETSLNGRDIGAIKVAERFSIVEIPEAAVNEVIGIMSKASIKGKRGTVRRYKEERH